MTEDAGAGWRITLDVDAAAVPAVEAALEPMADALSAFERGDGRWRIDVLTAEPPDAAALDVAVSLAAAASGAPPPDILIAPEAPRDWVAETVRAFPAVAVGPFHIFGSHDDPASVPPGRIGLLMDAGAAFGSGRHASTAGCLHALAGLARRPPQRALDLGCGSGLLAIAMARLWHRPIVAADIDDRAVAAAAANARANGVAPLVRPVRADGLRSAHIRAAAPFDLIAANILARPLKALAADLVRHLAPAGRAVLAGFVDRDAASVAAAYRARGLALERRITIDGWRTLVLRKPAAG